VLVAFSFQDGRLPVPPFKGVTLDWYAKVLGDDDLMAALVNSLLVAVVSSAGRTGPRLPRRPCAGPRAPAGVGPDARRADRADDGQLPDHRAGPSEPVQPDRGIRLSLWTTGIGHVVINLPLCFAITYAAMGDHQRTPNAPRATLARRSGRC
jgi:spermidine/putrescine transport system permease protein